MEQTLTPEEAMKQGYQFWGFGGERYQTLRDIEEIDKYDWESTQGMFLFEKYGYSPQISEEDLRELVAEHIECNHADETGDDTEKVYHIVKGLNFADMSMKINHALDKIQYYRLTDVKLGEPKH